MDIDDGRSGSADPSDARARINEELNIGRVPDKAGAESSEATEQLKWLSLGESKELVRHWVEDLGNQRYGQLALIAPDRGSIQATVDAEVIPPWLSREAGQVYVLFQQYRAIGIAHCSWHYALANIARLALIDGNGFVAVTEELSGVITVDPEPGDEVMTFSIEAWGELISA